MKAAAAIGGREMVHWMSVKFSMVALVFGVASILLAVGTQKVAASPMKIGVSLGLTGPADRWSKFQRMGIELAVEDLRKEGSDISIIVEDSQSKPAQSITLFNKLVATDRVDGVIGDIFSFITEPLIELSRQRKKLLISPSASRILCDKRSPFFFSTASQVGLSGEGFGYFLDRHPEVRRVALIYFQDAGWGYQYRDAWRKLLNERKLTIAGEFESAEFAVDFKTPLVKLLKESPDAFFVAQDPTTFLPAAKQLGFKGPIVFANNILELPAAGADLSSLEGLYFVDTQPQQAFERRFRERYNEAPLLEAYNGYEAVRVFVNAFRGRPDAPEQVVSKIEYDGIAGRIDFSESCAGNLAKWHLKQFREGGIQLIQ
jgi:branched-chain amino acid transport system substrate-binding protein